MSPPDTPTHIEKKAGNGQGDAGLTVAIVTYHPDAAWLDRTFRSLATAVAVALEAGTLEVVDIVVIDNAASNATTPQLTTLRKACNGIAHVRTHALAGHGNVGYGRGNNLGFAQYGNHEFFLVLNPDVEIDRDAIRAGVEHLRQHADCALISPAATAPDGQPLYLLRRAPSVAGLLLRGFAPAFVLRWFSRYLASYEYRAPGDPPFDTDLPQPVTASGCFMLMRSNAFRAVDGFDSSFFLYFEDFDLSLRLKKVGELVRIGACRIVHAGGFAANKGAHHRQLFMRSAIRYFNKHGWNLW